MYKFELADQTESTVNYRHLSSTYSKSKIYSLLFACSLILCIVVHFLVIFLTKDGTNFTTDNVSSENNSRVYQLLFPEHKNVSYSHFYEIADKENAEVTLLTTTEKPAKNTFRRFKIKLVNKTKNTKEKPLEHTSSRTAFPVNVGEAHSYPHSTSSTSANTPKTTTFETPVLATQTTQLPIQSTAVSSEPTQLTPSSSEAVVTNTEGNLTVQCGMRIVGQPSYGRSDGKWLWVGGLAR